MGKKKLLQPPIHRRRRKQLGGNSRVTVGADNPARPPARGTWYVSNIYADVFLSCAFLKLMRWEKKNRDFFFYRQVFLGKTMDSFFFLPTRENSYCTELIDSVLAKRRNHREGSTLNDVICTEINSPTYKVTVRIVFNRFGLFV